MMVVLISLLLPTLVVFVFLIIFAIVFLIFWQFYFLRNPKRIPPTGNNIVSPADGTVAFVIPFSRLDSFVHKKFIGRVHTLIRDVSDRGFLILIVMTPFDVHYQRSPISGKISRINYSKGKFLNALSDNSKFRTIENEKNEFIIESDIGRFKVVQIAGVLARRIECFVSEEQKVNKGDVIGRINLGSQVLLVLPYVKGLDLVVKKGMRVFAGKSIIARF